MRDCDIQLQAQSIRGTAVMSTKRACKFISCMDQGEIMTPGQFIQSEEQRYIDKGYVSDCTHPFSLQFK